MEGTKTRTETQTQISQKGDKYTVKTTTTTTVTELGKEPKVSVHVTENVYEGKDALDKMPEQFRKQLEDKKKPEIKDINKKACDDDFEKDLLHEINKFREAHGVSSLKICKDLTKHAEERVKQMAEKDEMLSNKSDFGENVGCNWSSDPNHKVDAGHIAKKWYEESNSYDFAKEPETMAAGHFTQMVWKGCEKFGAAAAKSKSNSVYFIAVFSPSGNWRNEFVENVLPKKKSIGSLIKSLITKDSDSSSDDDDDDEARDDFNKEGVKVHNAYRRKHGVPKLKYSAALAKYAQDWADKLASTNKFEHRQERKYGENIYTFTTSAHTKPSAEQACKSWYSEIERYSFGGKNGAPGTGHFTQIVWKKSTSLGMGVAKGSRGNWIVVANYDPPGNFVGQHAENVPPVKG